MYIIDKKNKLKSSPDAQTSFLKACLIFITKNSIKLPQYLLVVAILTSTIATLPIFPSSVDALSKPTDEATCVKYGGKWIVATPGSLASRLAKASCSITIAAMMSPDDEAKSKSYFVSLGNCIQDKMRGDFGTQAGANGSTDPNAGWFDTGDKAYVIYPDGMASCPDIAKKALDLWGWGTDYSGFLRDMGYTFQADVPRYHGPDPSGDGGVRRAHFEKAVFSKIFNDTNYFDVPISDAGWYNMYFHAFTGDTCKAKDLGLYTSITDPTWKQWVDSGHTAGAAESTVNFGSTVLGSITYTKIFVTDKDGSIAEHGYAYNSSDTVVSADGGLPIDNPRSVLLYGQSGDSKKGNSQTCQQLAKSVSDTAPGWQTWKDDHPGLDVAVPTTNEVDKNKPNKDKPSCGIEGIGWLVCPVMGFLGQVTDTAFAFLATNFLSVDVSLFNTSSATYSAWSVMRNFANVAFVIAFMIIIYAQLTSSGISNYGIKKMLPRLIVAAVLVNTSYFVCQLAVDLSNILGFTIKELFDSIGTSIKTTSDGASDATGHAGGVAILVAALLVGGVTVIFALSMPVLIATVVALLVIAMILLARKALIVLLIVIAPLAFVAYLLPNTEHLFKKWQKMFTTLLLVFPVISALFGAATLASKIIKDAKPDDQMTSLIAVGVAAMPLFLVPALLKGATAAAGTLGAKLNGWGDKAHGRVGGKVSETSRLGQFNKYRKGESDRRRALIQAGAYKGSNKNPLNWGRNVASGGNKLFNEGAISGKFGNRSAAAGITIAKKIEDEEVGSAVQQLSREAINSGDSEGFLADKLRGAVKSGDAIATRAAYTALTEQGMGGIAKIQETLGQPDTLSALNGNNELANSLRGHILSNHADVKTKDNRIMQWASGQNANKDFEGVTDNEGHARHLDGLTDSQVASQTAKSIASAQLTAEQATRILEDKVIQPNLRGDQRAALEAVVSAGGQNLPQNTNNQPPIPPQPQQPPRIP